MNNQELSFVHPHYTKSRLLLQLIFAIIKTINYLQLQPIYFLSLTPFPFH